MMAINIYIYRWQVCMNWGGLGLVGKIVQGFVQPKYSCRKWSDVSYRYVYLYLNNGHVPSCEIECLMIMTSW